VAESLLRRALLLGIGALSWSRERAEALVDELVGRDDLDAGTRESLVQALMERGRRDEENLRAFVSEQVARAVRTLPVATKEDLRQLEERLRAEMAAWRKAGPSGED
jgi:polyhydroxyalkanoate synthesis regulator phasin